MGTVTKKRTASEHFNQTEDRYKNQIITYCHRVNATQTRSAYLSARWALEDEGYILYTYLSLDVDNYRRVWHPKSIKQETKLSKNKYYSAIADLKDNGFLVERENANKIFDFYVGAQINNWIENYEPEEESLSPEQEKVVPPAGKSIPEIGQTCPDLGQTIPNIGQIIPEIGQAQLNENINLGQTIPKLGQVCPEIGTSFSRRQEKYIYKSNKEIKGITNCFHLSIDEIDFSEIDFDTLEKKKLDGEKIRLLKGTYNKSYYYDDSNKIMYIVDSGF